MLFILDESNPHSEILLFQEPESDKEAELLNPEVTEGDLSAKDIETLENVGRFVKIVNYPEDMDYDDAVKYIKQVVINNLEKGSDIRKSPSSVIDISYENKVEVDFHMEIHKGTDTKRISSERIDDLRQHIQETSGLSEDFLKRLNVAINAVNKYIPPFERIRRITGYLVGTLDRFNDGKRAEVKDRVKHGVMEDMTSDYGRGIEEETYQVTQSQNDDFVIDERGILFEYTGNAESINIPDNVKIIADSVFKDNKTVKHVSIPEGVTEIGERAFEGCSYLRTVNLPASLESIGERAFGNCGQLTYINSPQNLNLKNIKTGAFYNCQSMEFFVIPKTVKVISPSAFEQCHSLRGIDLPQGLEGIGMYAFRGCVSLDSIDLPDTLKRIGDGAFDKCISLIKVDVPRSVKYSVGEKASFPKTCKVNDKSVGLEK